MNETTVEQHGHNLHSVMQTFANVKKAFMENIFFRPRQPYMQTLYVYMYTLFAAYRIKGNKA